MHTVSMGMRYEDAWGLGMGFRLFFPYISSIYMYSVIPFSLQIIKEDVDQFKPELTIPSCLVELQWTGGEQVPPKQLRHKVTLKGAKSPAFFHIRHDPPTAGEGNSIAHSYTTPIRFSNLLCG